MDEMEIRDSHMLKIGGMGAVGCWQIVKEFKSRKVKTSYSFPEACRSKLFPYSVKMYSKLFIAHYL
jgi:hypothetical protein